MKLIRNFFLLAIISFFPKQTLSIEFKYETYLVRNRENLETISKKFLPSYQIKYGDRIEEFRDDLKTWNKHVKNWDDLPEGLRIYIENPFPVFVGSSDYAPNLMPDQNVETTLREYRVADFFEESNNKSKKIFLGGFYTASSGTFKEKINSNLGEISFKQNSPYSLGLQGGILLKDITHSLNGSFYWSNLSAPNLSGDGVSSTKSLSVPAEVGYNFYYQYFFKNAELGIYGGFDHERFTTFNTLDLFEGSNLKTIENKINFGTIGISKTFYLGEQKFLTKLSYAKSMSSESSNTRINSQFEGNRLLLFLSMRGAYNISYHVLYKRHQLKGPTELTIDRIGLGFGYQFY